MFDLYVAVKDACVYEIMHFMWCGAGHLQFTPKSASAMLKPVVHGVIQCAYVSMHADAAACPCWWLLYWIDALYSLSVWCTMCLHNIEFSCIVMRRVSTWIWAVYIIVCQYVARSTWRWHIIDRGCWWWRMYPSQLIVIPLLWHMNEGSRNINGHP